MPFALVYILEVVHQASVVAAITDHHQVIMLQYGGKRSFPGFVQLVSVLRIVKWVQQQVAMDFNDCWTIAPGVDVLRQRFVAAD